MEKRRDQRPQMKHRKKKSPREKESLISSATYEETEWNQRWKRRLEESSASEDKAEKQRREVRHERCGNEGKEGKIKDPAKTREKYIQIPTQFLYYCHPLKQKQKQRKRKKNQNFPSLT